MNLVKSHLGSDHFSAERGKGARSTASHVVQPFTKKVGVLAMGSSHFIKGIEDNDVTTCGEM
jgi:hypothetical protein